MKKVVLSLFFLGTLSVVQASVYPDKLNDNNSFAKYEYFRGIYDKIYQDVHEEDLVEVCERTLSWPEFWDKRGGEPELIYSISNCTNFHGKKNFSESFLNNEKRNNMDFNAFVANFKNRFELEQKMLRRENNSKRRTGLASIFTDGTEETKTSPFDVVSTLNKIDKTFFGLKAGKPVYEYTKNKLEKNLATEDVYLSQTEDNLPSIEEDFAETSNISGALWQSGKKVLREKLNPYPLWLTYIGKHMGDAVDTDGVLGDAGFTAETHSFPTLPTTQPEANIARYNPLSKLNSFNEQFQFGQSAFATEAEKDNRRRDQLGVVFDEKDRQQTEIQNALFQFEKEQLRNYEEASFGSVASNFNYLKKVIEAFREKVKIINEDIFPPFLEKPIHSS